MKTAETMLDDTTIESQLTDEERAELEAYAREWDVNAAALATRRMILHCVPIVIVSLAILFWAWR